jgi:hypothetical protein
MAAVRQKGAEKGRAMSEKVTNKVTGGDEGNALSAAMTLRKTKRLKYFGARCTPSPLVRPFKNHIVGAPCIWALARLRAMHLSFFSFQMK